MLLLLGLTLFYTQVIHFIIGHVTILTQGFFRGGKCGIFPLLKMALTQSSAPTTIFQFAPPELIF